MRERASGILMHISSLPGRYGIGDFGKNAYRYVDYLKKSDTHNWQILPLGITGYGDSPYQSFSAYAGNPYFIDFDELLELGYLTEEEISVADFGNDKRKVDYGKLYENKMPLLRKAFERAKEKEKNNFEKFFEEEKSWLEDFSMYMAIKNVNSGAPWLSWEEGLRMRKTESLTKFRDEHGEEIEFWIFTQYFFFKQWKKLKKYANDNGVKIIGDIPIYVSIDGSDVWANPQYYDLKENLSPRVVAGCPPDEFSEDGQLWGNPIYNWKEMKKDNYKWFINRINESFRLYDVVRIDHFRGFESYWEIPSGDKTAVNGQWVKGPGAELFDEVKRQIGDKEILAEDLGFMTTEVKDMIRKTGYPGMKVLVFAFSDYQDNDFLPHNYNRNSVVYTANHDTQTVEGYIKSAKKADIKFIDEYLNKKEDESYSKAFIRAAWSSVAYLSVCQMQEILELDDSARFNVPSTLGNNWNWRMTEEDFREEDTEFIKSLNKLYRR